jgi:hypothetical protein
MPSQDHHVIFDTYSSRGQTVPIVTGTKSTLNAAPRAAFGLMPSSSKRSENGIIVMEILRYLVRLRFCFTNRVRHGNYAIK